MRGFLFLFLLIGSFASAQNSVVYDNLNQPDPRIRVVMRHHRTIGLGAQFVGVELENLTDEMLSVSLDYFAVMTCGETLHGKIGFGGALTLKPRQKTKAGGFWDTDNTSFDAGNRRSSACMASANKSVKLADGSYSAIASVGFELLGIKVLNSTTQTGNKPGTTTGTGTGAGTGNGSGGQGGTGNPGGNRPPASGDCKASGFKLSGTPSYSCAAIEWIYISNKTLTTKPDGSVVNNGDPDATGFIVEYKKESDLYWKTIKKAPALRNIVLMDHLSACTRYEVRLTTLCENGASSMPTNILTFSTDCPRPNSLKIENISSTTAEVNRGRTVVDSYPCPSPNQKDRVQEIEYRTATGIWQSMDCNFGEICRLTLLSPGTSYKVRARYRFPSNIYSNYTNEVAFTTRP